MDEFEHINNKFPHEVLIMFFSYLPRDDIITVQRVCHNWRAAAQDTCLWDNYTLTLTGKPEDEKKIIIMPALRNISGHAENHMVNIILENTLWLNKMNCFFHPYISTAQVQSVIEKYPELESISLHLSAPDVLQSVEVLKGSKHLKELLFDPAVWYRPNGEPSPKYVLMVHICDLFADENNFPALRKLDVPDIYSSGNYDHTKAVVANIISKRSLMLQSLKLQIGITDYADILNSVFMCAKLEELHLQFITGREGVLNTIIENAKQLKSLIYIDEEYQTCEQELKHTSTLTKLQRIQVSGLQSITKEGIMFLAGCHNLNYLCLMVCSSEDTFCADIAVVMRSMKKLGHFSFYNSEMTFEMRSMYFPNREKIENFISQTLSL